MTQTLEAIFDGLILRPLEPLELAPNTRVTVVLTVPDVAAGHPTVHLPEPSPTEPGTTAAAEDETEDLYRYMCENYFYSDFYLSKK